jgi:hypothetical protein
VSTAAPRVRYRNVVFDSGRWEGFRFRDDDIVLSTPPKSGTTLTQMICALLILGDPARVTSIDEFSPWLDMQTRPLDALLARLEAQRHRRVIKTHTPLDGLPWDDRVTYVCVARDPRDVAISWDHHAGNIDLDAFLAARAGSVGLDDLSELMPDGLPARPADPAERFWAWVDEPNTGGHPPSLPSVLHHLGTFWAVRDRPNVLLAHFEDLTGDLAGQMRRLAAALGIDVPEDRWPEFVAAARFDAMKARADTLAPEVSNRTWKSNAGFFHRGTNGQWQDLLDEAGRRRYAARALELAAPDLLDWAHGASPWR